LYFPFFVFGVNDLASFLLSQFVRERAGISRYGASGDIWGKNQCDIRNPASSGTIFGKCCPFCVWLIKPAQEND
jgi:hypothetical protein